MGSMSALLPPCLACNATLPAIRSCSCMQERRRLPLGEEQGQRQLVDNENELWGMVTLTLTPGVQSMLLAQICGHLPQAALLSRAEPHHSQE